MEILRHKKTTPKAWETKRISRIRVIGVRADAIALIGILAIRMDVGNNAKTSGNLTTGIVKRTKGDCANAKANRMLPVTELETNRVCGKILVSPITNAKTKTQKGDSQ